MRYHSGGTTSTGLLVLILIFILFIGLIIVFFQQFISNLAYADSTANVIMVTTAIALPLILLAIIVFQISKLAGERARRLPGTRFKTRLLLFFAFIALFSSIPQAILSINFINSAITFWLDVQIGEALKGGLNISLDYYDDKVETLRNFGTSYHLRTLLQGMERNPDRVWNNIKELNSDIDFIEVFDHLGREVFFRGSVDGRVTEFSTIQSFNGSLPKVDREGFSILRHLSRHRIEGEDYAVLSGIVLSSDFARQVRSITESLETFNQLGRYKDLFKRVIVVFYFLFSFPVFLLSILVSFLLADEIIQPIVNLEEATRLVAEGDFTVRILSRSNDELSVLVSSFNRMVGELSGSRKKLLQAEKISAWQEIAQRLAHEIKNPLTPIKLSAQRILKKYDHNKDEFDRILVPAITAIIEEVENLDKMLIEFREFTRLPLPTPERLNLKNLVKEVTAMYRQLSRGVRVDISGIPEELELSVDRNQMKQVFANLIKNAIQAMADGGEITLRADVVEKEDRSFCRIWIRDTGEGIDELVGENIFHPYFTTKKDGTGLGLAIVERVIFDHSGTIHFETQKNIGTTFIIDLPMEL